MCIGSKLRIILKYNLNFICKELKKNGNVNFLDYL